MPKYDVNMQLNKLNDLEVIDYIRVNVLVRVPFSSHPYLWGVNCLNDF